MAKLWGGRFENEISGFADEWAASLPFDKALYKEDICGSIAHARMLAKQGILTEADARLIVSGLEEILDDISSGKLDLTADGYEDIHTAVESVLTERIGAAGKRLHTARSRNDQVATDTRLWLKEGILKDIGLLSDLRRALIKTAREHTDTVMPGYTHLQHAQPVSFAFHLMAYQQMFTRDAGRLWDCYGRTDAMPLGSGALAGTTYESDREYLADELGFAGVCSNAMDAVSDRDFVIEYIGACAIIMTHLSRFCEEIILWSSSEFGFVDVDDAFSTGSSIMPQKKNPDMAELIRGKSGRVYGDLMNILTVMKGLPLAYNKDMQEDKIPLFDAADTVSGSVAVFTAMFETLKINADAMEAAAKKGYMNATDAADYLVRKGVPFREAHEAVGKLVLHAIKEGKPLEDLSLDEFLEHSGKFEKDIYDAIDIRACMDAKLSEGSTSLDSVEAQIAAAEESLGSAD
ncbi:MAG: argininosuccinate lyase [Clostridiales Family XIII bacterium]|jgi:argininosuccinate lyase|nr:argininosuccinate lyase [Clostridiales Family XIII bacterium]